MAKLTERERLNVWKNRVGWSKDRREKYIKEYERSIAYYKGDQWDPTKTALTEGIVVNLIFAHIKATLPSLYFQNPKFYLNARGLQYEPIELIGKGLLEYYVKRCKMKQYVRLATLDGIILFGVLKAGYEPDFVNNPKKKSKYQVGTDTDGIPIYIIDPDIGMPLEEPDELLINENFFITGAVQGLMLFDPEPVNFVDDMFWIGESVIERLDDVKNNDNYDSKVRKELKESHMASAESFYGAGQQMPEIDDDLKRVELIHIYDMDERKYRVYAECQDDSLGFLFEEDTPDGIDGHPYSIIKFHEIPDEFIPISEIDVVRSIQDEQNKFISMLLVHAKRFLRKYTYESGTFANETEMEKFKEPEDGMMVEVNKNMTGAIKPVEDAVLDPALYQGLQELQSAFWKTIGASESQRQVVERRKSAFEASQISKFGQLRTEDKVSLVEDWIRDAGKRLFDQLQANMRLPIAIKIIGDRGQYWKEDLTRDEIQGDVDVDLEIGSTGPKIPEFERQELAQFLQAISGLPGIEAIISPMVDKELNLGELINEVGKLYDIDTERIFRQRQPGQMPPMPSGGPPGGARSKKPKKAGGPIANAMMMGNR